MSDKQFLPLPNGKNDFTSIKRDGCYFVDKTSYLKALIDTDKSEVMLFTRPRRFGKTVFMSTLNSFLRIDKDHPFDTTVQQELFKGTEILKDTKFCEKYMGQYPVIFITLKGVDGLTFEKAYEMFAITVSRVASKYKYLLDSPKLDADDKEKLKRLTDEYSLMKTDNAAILKTSLKTLSDLLYKEYGKLPVLLIDEYDVPLAKASYHDALKYRNYTGNIDENSTYHHRMATLMSGFLDILKDGDTLTKTVITGCLKVAKNSIFTGVNNLYVNTVVSRKSDYTGLIGFTKDETYKFLKDYEMDDYSDLVKENYDGYRFDDKEMFCPWDVVNFINENCEFKQKGELYKISAGNYWLGTSSNSALYEYIGYLTDKDTQKMQDLVDGNSISFNLNDSMNYDSLSEHNPDDFWSLLLHTGYLTVDWDSTKAQTDKSIICARIPNQEILDCFVKNIKNKFRNELTKDNTAQTLVNSLFEGKSEEVSDILFDLLQNYVSVRDTATKAPHENYYHGFLNGLFSNCKDIIKDYQSNAESGDGYADITFKSQRGNSAVIIEIKAVSKDDLLDDYAQKALNQIAKMNYATPFFKAQRIRNIFTYGISFCRKDCAVELKKIK